MGVNHSTIIYSLLTSVDNSLINKCQAAWCPLQLMIVPQLNQIVAQ